MIKPDKHCIIAVDFDETLANTKYPYIHSLKHNAKEVMQNWYDKNYLLLIHTCRAGEQLLEAENFLIRQGVKFHHINEQHPYLIHIFENDTRKLAADIYIDDKDVYAQSRPDFPNWLDIEQKVELIVNSEKFKSILDFQKK